MFSADSFRHRTPSCDHQRSRCRLLLPPIVVHRRHRCRQATTTTTATPVVELTVIHCRRKRQQQQHHQRTNGSTNVKIFTSPVNLDLFNLSRVFEVCDVGRGNLAISTLLALKKNWTIFAIYILLDESLYIFGRWCRSPISKLLELRTQRKKKCSIFVPDGMDFLRVTHATQTSCSVFVLDGTDFLILFFVLAPKNTGAATKATTRKSVSSSTKTQPKWCSVD